MGRRQGEDGEPFGHVLLDPGVRVSNGGCEASVSKIVSRSESEPMVRSGPGIWSQLTQPQQTGPSS